MQNDIRFRLIEILMDSLCYAYCDNCKRDGSTLCCDECHRKYQNWALGPQAAAQIVDRILLELGVTVDAE